MASMEEDEELEFSSGLNPDVESYLKQMSLERERVSSPDYKAAQSAYRNAQYGGDLAPQRFAAYSQALSQLGTLGGKSPQATAAAQYAQSIGQEQNLQAAREQKDEAERDKQTGLHMKALQFLEDKKRKQEEALAQREATSQNLQEKLQSQRDLANDRMQMMSAMRGSSNDFKQAMLDLKRQDMENKQEELASRREDRRLKDAQEKEPKANQFLAGSFGKRIEQANQIMGNLEKEGFNRGSALSGLAALLPGAVQGDQTKQQEQAERNFVNALLRRESGAAISPSEFDNAELQYFPRAGDSSKVIAQKKQNRDQALASLQAEAGPAWQKIPSVPLAPPEAESMFGESKAIAAPKDTVPPDKVKVVSPDGTTGTIPKSKLESALKRGFKQVD